MKILEKYNIIETISETVKCTIFKAISKNNKEKVIIRVIYNSSSVVLKCMPDIRSPYVVQVLSVTQDGSDVVMVESFIDGISLSSLLKNGEKFTETETLKLFTELSCALDAIHHKDIIHRDIKPNNIMIQNGAAVLIDFDVARQNNPRHLEDTVPMGTKGYAAPEQYGFSQTDNRSDIYSLGVVIKELLGDDFDNASYKSIVDKCMELDPKNRYQTAVEILEDINKLPLTASAREIRTPILKIKHNQARKILKIAGCFLMAICIALVMQPMPHEIKVLDYILSKMVYLVLIVFLFVPFLNIFRIRNWFPLFQNKRIMLRMMGYLLYLIFYILLVVLANLLAQTFYSGEAKEILSASGL